MTLQSRERLQRLGELTRHALGALADVLYPPACAGCDTPLGDGPLPIGHAFCATCAISVEAVAGPLHVPDPELPASRIPDLAAAIGLPDGLLAPYLFGGQLAVAIRRLKYARSLALGPLLGKLLANTLVDILPRGALSRVDLVLPVPLYRRRQRERGFNQATLLAVALARAAGCPLHTGLLRRQLDLAPQATLEGAARRAIERAFAPTPQGRRQLPGQRILLVDDVITTGSTARAAAAALREAGASQVLVAALARTP